MWWLGLAFFSTVLAAPVSLREPQDWSCSSSDPSELCFTYPEGCTSCDARLKIIHGDLTTEFEIFTTVANVTNTTVASIKITEPNGARHVVVCSPMAKTVSTFLDRKELTDDQAVDASFIDGSSTSDYVKCNIKIALSIDDKNVYHISSGNRIGEDLFLTNGLEVEKYDRELKSRSLIAGEIDEEKIAESGSVSVKEFASELVAPKSITNSTEPSISDAVEEPETETLTKSVVEPTPSSEETNSTMPINNRLSESAIQKKQFADFAQSRAFDDDAESLNNSTILETSSGNTTAVVEVDDKEIPDGSLTKRLDSNETLELPGAAKKPSQKKSGSAVTPADDLGKREDLDDDPDHSSTTFPIASSVITLLVLLL